MKLSSLRSPYLLAIGVALAVTAAAWIGRGRYQPVITGSVAPDFTALDMDGNPVSLADHAGRVVLVNVWATWCEPCKVEMPAMQRMYEALSGTDFEILAVSVDARLGSTDVAGRPGGDLEAFAREMGLTFPILHDAAGTIERTYQTTGVPETFVIGRDGLIYKKIAGPTDWDAKVNVDLVRRLLGGS